MNDKYINLLIEKFWNGNASEEEVAYLSNLLENDKDIKDKFYAAFETVESSEHLMQDERGKDVLKIINEKIKNDRSVLRLRTYKKIMSWAAVAAVLLVCSIVLEKYLNEGNSSENHIASIIKMDTISNRSNIMKEITMPDGSMVLLYPKGSISFKHTFQKREIGLSGKAYFNVVHNTKRIFSVAAGEVLTTDIGTEFEIDASKKEKTVIRLLQGKIKVGKTQKSKLAIEDRYLNVGEMLTINTRSGKAILSRPLFYTKANKVSEEKLVFNKTPLNTVFKRIEKKYNVEIVYNINEVSKLTFTGNVESNDSLLDILNTICYINNLKCSANSDSQYSINRD